MFKSLRAGKLGAALALNASVIAPAMVAPLTPAHAQDYSPMSATCQAASNQAQSENAQTPGPPSDANVVVQMQHILYMTGLLLDALDQSCRDWPDYARSREQFQSTYDSTMRTCRQVASDPSECHRKAYGS